MFKNPITFDSFIRGVMVIAVAVGIGMLINRLSGVHGVIRVARVGSPEAKKDA